MVLYLASVGVTLAQQLPPGFVLETVMDGWTEPVGATWDANGRAYVWEKRGTVWIIEDGVRLPDPLIDISEEVGNWHDHGLLGFALDPQFLGNGRFYLLYLVDRHHLLNHGTPAYDPAVNDYYAASIMRITRYSATGPAFTTADPGSRFVLLGETPSTGAVNLHLSHSCGSLLFGEDGTLLAAIGDGASYSTTDVGNVSHTYYAQALADGILRPEENVGAFRSQMIDSHSGKVLRLDPETGDGLASNPWYDPSAPRAPRSRVWALGLRNPFRMGLRPGSGSTDPADARPGTLFISDVGWVTWEELNVSTRPGQNFGWPLYEGYTANANFMGSLAEHPEVPNPLYLVGGCIQSRLRFMDLLAQETPAPLGAHTNPCSPGTVLPPGLPLHFHRRPAIDWLHGNRSRCGAFSGNQAITFDLDDAASPVPGPRFGGSAAIAGTWLKGVGWPAGYQQVFIAADFAGGWARRIRFDGLDRPARVDDFATGLGALVWLGEAPDGTLWTIDHYGHRIRRIRYTLPVDLPPVAVASANVTWGPAPLAVQFSSAGSADPEGGPLSYYWDFGNGFNSTQPNPARLFNVGGGEQAVFVATLTVTDAAGQSHADSLTIHLNNSPPVVQLTGFPDGAFYPIGIDSLFSLTAEVSDAEHGPDELTWEWSVYYHANGDEYLIHTSAAPTDDVLIGGVGCFGGDHHYTATLTVTDAGGLGTTVTHTLLPGCDALGPTAVILLNTAFGEGPLEVQFDGTASFSPGGITGYQWDFGDGTGSTAPQPLKTFTDVGPYAVVLTVEDAGGNSAQAMRMITVLDTLPPQCAGTPGSIMREYYADIPGETIGDLVQAAIFPDNPTSVNYPTALQGPTNLGNTYGTRFRGWIIAPSTGEYEFIIVSDDHSRAFLSPNADPLYKQLLCYVPGWTNPGQFNKFTSQSSGPMELREGRYYYVEVLHKEGSGGDHVALYWRTPGNNTPQVVPGSALAPWAPCPTGVSVRLALQGPYDEQTGLMRDDLRQAGLVPLEEPYTALGFTQADGGGGETTTAIILQAAGKNGVVDWVLVELRDKNDPSLVVATRCALLERDGDLRGADGHGRLQFTLPADEYHIAVRHRNHLGVRTAAPVYLDGQATLIDLTLPATAVHGTEPQRTMANGRRALWAGDVTMNGWLRYTGADNDRDPVLVAVGGDNPTGVVPGYAVEDVNMDGLVKYTGADNDRDPILQNLPGAVPTGQRQGQLP